MGRIHAAVLAAALEHPEIGVFAVDLNRQIVFHDVAFARLVGRSGADLLGTSYDALLDSSERSVLNGRVRELVSGHHLPAWTDRLYRTPDGAARWLRAIVQVIAGENGEPSMIAGFVQDVTEQRAALQQAESEVTRRRRAEADRLAAEQQHRALMDASPAAITITQEGIIRYVNPAAARMLGVASPADVVGQPVIERIHPDHRERVTSRVRALESAPPTGSAEELVLVHTDGSEVTVVPVLTPRLWEGQPALQGTLLDVTAARNVARDLAEREHFHTEVLDSMAAQTVIIDRAGLVLAFNRAWSEHLLRLPGARIAVGADFLAFCRTGLSVHSPSSATLAHQLDLMLAGAIADLSMDLELRPPAGPTRWYGVHATPLSSAGGGIVLNLTEVTDRKSFEYELQRQAMHDPLTHLPNRLLLRDRLDRALSSQPRSHNTVAVLFVDIDNFKLINDSYGHSAGDRVLVEVARRLNLTTRPTDTVARFAGDEFVVLLEELPGREEIVAFAERILGAVRGSYVVEETDVRLSASIGIAIAPGGQTGGDLMRDADTALFEAKAAGRDCAVMFDSALSGRARARLQTSQDLRHAVDREELELHYQPLLDLRTGRVVGAEALVRWRRPGHGLLAPAAFIHIAEDSGVAINSLGGWVISHAIRWAAERNASTGPLSVSVNVAARQFASAGFVDLVARELDEACFPPGMLTLEITESAVMADPTAATVVLDNLKKLGVRLSVDDFGTGYSSLAYLQRFPVDELKIDGSFVDGVDTDPADAAIVTAVISLAHTLGLTVVAEGIETQSQLDCLRALGCERGQGFLIGHPQPDDQFRAWLAAH